MIRRVLIGAALGGGAYLAVRVLSTGEPRLALEAVKHPLLQPLFPLGLGLGAVLAWATS